MAEAIVRCLRLLPEHPHAGRPTERPDIRELIERRYGYIIPYTILGETIWILRIYDARRDPQNKLPAGDAPRG